MSGFGLEQWHIFKVWVFCQKTRKLKKSSLRLFGFFGFGQCKNYQEQQSKNIEFRLFGFFGSSHRCLRDTQNYSTACRGSGLGKQQHLLLGLGCAKHDRLLWFWVCADHSFSGLGFPSNIWFQGLGLSNDTFFGFSVLPANIAVWSLGFGNLRRGLNIQTFSTQQSLAEFQCFVYRVRLPASSVGARALAQSLPPVQQ